MGKTEMTRTTAPELDAVIVGAGFAGLYMLHLLRDKQGLKATVIEGGDGVGGTWYWNRYPGARCDIPSMDYSYSFSEELQQEWVWSEKYAAQPEILSYLEFVAKKFDLKKDIRFGAWVTAADFDEAGAFWRVTTHDGKVVTARHLISGVGVLSTAATPVFPGAESFKGDVLLTHKWPKDGYDFKGKKVGIIGTGATGMQVIPVVVETAGHLTVFQRTPGFAAPLMNEPLTHEEQAKIKANYTEHRRGAWESFAGVEFHRARPSALADTPEQRQAHYEACWSDGGFSIWLGAYNDVLFDLKANETAGNFVREKIRAKIKDPKLADMLVPKPGVVFGTKRQPCETNYFETYNRDNVSLVDIKAEPIERLTEKGIKTAAGEYELDALIYATGFDAFTGPLFKLNLRGRNGRRLQDHWAAGPQTYLGLMSHGFPNFYTVTGPLSPSVLFNMPLSIEQHCEWIADCIAYMKSSGIAAIEPTREAEVKWVNEVREIADTTLLPAAESWYLGANVPGKARVFLVYLGGFQRYRQVCAEVAARGYEGFILESDTKADAVA